MEHVRNNFPSLYHDCDFRKSNITGKGVKKMKLVILAILSFGAAVVVLAQSPPPSGTTPPRSAAPPGANLPVADFVYVAEMDGMAEVQASQMALQKAQGENVKQFARMMIADHTKANEELTAIASKKHLALPGDLDSDLKGTLQELGEKSGTAFDTTYLTDMTEAHDGAIALFNAAKSSGDVDIAGFAAKTLPVLQMHRQALAKLVIPVH